MARTYNGSSQYAYVDTGLSLGANDAIWVSLWLWMNNSAAAYGVFNIGISGSTNHYRRITTSGGTVLAGTGGAGTSSTASAAISGSSQWHHVLAEWGSATSRTVTVNGGTPGTNTTNQPVGSAPSHIRLASTLNLSAYLAGRLAYVAIFSGTPDAQDYIDLSGSGVAADAWHPTLTYSAANLLAYWDLDGSASPEPDGVASNDLTLVNTPTGSTSPAIQLVAPSDDVVLAQGWWL
jgi:hypothetical protein